MANQDRNMQKGNQGKPNVEDEEIQDQPGNVQGKQDIGRQGGQSPKGFQPGNQQQPQKNAMGLKDDEEESDVNE
jgi:hypothetical protein